MTQLGAGTDTLEAREVILEVDKLTKSFAGTTVVNQVSLFIRAGEVVGLVGQNGCGKSTLIRMLAGFYKPDGGSFSTHTRDGRQVVLSFVHQDPGLVPALTVTENLGLGKGYPMKRGRVDWKAAATAAKHLIAAYGIRAEPSTKVSDLSPADATLLAIARSFGDVSAAAAGVLVLDEPTSTLGKEESERILEAARRTAAQGWGVLFVSHRLDEVLRVTDRIIVMRDGQFHATYDSGQTTTDQIIETMIGRPLSAMVSERPDRTSARAVLRVDHLTGKVLRDCTFEVKAGEIVGVTGLLGSGKSELGRMLFGVQPARSGTVEIDGKPTRIKSPGGAIAAGMGYVPPDRRSGGGIALMNAFENLTLPYLPSFLDRGTLRRNSELRVTREWMAKANVSPPRPLQRFDRFSGGNQQKIVCGKWVRHQPKVLVLDDPTVGVDVDAVQVLYRIIRETAENGCAVLLLSSEWEHLARLANRVMVLDAGHHVATLSGQSLTADGIASAAFGHSKGRS